ncbi:MAG: serine/threonine-protein kinase [Acidimicrobiales bacterium]
MGISVPGRILNVRYRLGALLGRGGMAEVYEAHDELLDRPVAVKMLRPDMAANPEVRSRFEIEARSAARLHHPNVVSVFDTGEDGGDPYLVMELLPGESLADRVGKEGVAPEWLCRVAGDVLAALGAAHDAGLVHRDVKPANVLLTAAGQAKVADFGIAKSIEAVGGDLTSTGMLLGTPAYLAPERIDGEPATPQSDLYSLGVVLYEALAGVKPFVGNTPMAMASAIVTLPAPSLDVVRPGLEPRLVAAVERAMAKDAADRPATAAEMAADLGLTASEDGTVAMAGVAMAGGAVADGTDPTVVAGPAALGVAVPAGPARGATVLAGRRGVVAGILAAAAVLLFIVVAALAGGGADGDGLPGRLVSLADRVEAGEGAKGPEAAEGLRDVADQVRAGGGGGAATELVRNAYEWNRSGGLSGVALADMVEVLGDVPGVDPTALTTTTTIAAPPTTTAPPPSPRGGDEERGKGKGGGKDNG